MTQPTPGLPGGQGRKDESPPIPPAPQIRDPTQRGRGRPPFFESHPQAWAKLILSLRAGNTFQASAMYAGISRRAFYKFLQLGRKAKSGPWQEFMHHIDEAIAAAEILHVGYIARAGRDGAWKASAFLLSARNPKHWAPARKVALSQPDFETPVVFEMKLPSPRGAAQPPHTPSDP